MLPFCCIISKQVGKYNFPVEILDIVRSLKMVLHMHYMPISKHISNRSMVQITHNLNGTCV